MKFKLYNSLSRKVEEFIPLNEIVRIYSCGPTVYDNVHIGNLSSFIFADNLYRALIISGYTVKHVMNITDLDDKTIKRSKVDFPEDSPEIALKNLTNFYQKLFLEDLIKVGNNTKSLIFIKATDSILLMQEIISKLIKNDFAYIADDGIYFSIDAYKNNNKKYGQLVELTNSSNSHARINNDEYDKESANDFALWKFAKPNEPSWSYIINQKDYMGRPGWHIECSAMSSETLGLPFDIHTGGVDLKFPHHENEIAQSTAGSNSKIYANIFAHNEHLLVNKHKMSKSLGNFINIEDIEERNFDPLAFRMLILQSHYRNQSNFSWDLLEAANNRLVDLRNFALLTFQTKIGTEDLYDFDSFINEIKEILLNDLDMPKTLAYISNVQNIIQENLVNNTQEEKFKDFISFIDSLLGLNLSSQKDIEPEFKEMLKNREYARKNNDWKKSDEIRDVLLKYNIIIRDTKYGQVWNRI